MKIQSDEEQNDWIRKASMVHANAQNKDIRDLIQIGLNIGSTSDLEIFARRSLGEINFADGLPIFQQLVPFFQLIATTSWDLVPSGTIGTIKQQAQELADRLREVVAFSMQGRNDPAQERDRIIAKVKIAWQACYAASAPHIAFVTSKAVSESVQSGVSEQQKQFLAEIEKHKASASEVMESLNDFKTQASNSLGQVQEVLKNVQDSAKETGVTLQAEHFAKLTKWYFRGAVAWLAAAILLGIITYCYAGRFIVQAKADQPIQSPLIVSSTNVASAPAIAAAAQPARLDMMVIIRGLVPRLLRVTLLLTALVFSLKNFSAMGHNYVVNRHRQTALTTFQTFVSGTADPQIKNAVLLQATQAIFSPQPSAFLKGESESPQVTPIYEIVKSVTGKPSGE